MLESVERSKVGSSALCVTAMVSSGARRARAAMHSFRGTFRFNVERYADVLVERAVGKGAATLGQ